MSVASTIVFADNITSPKSFGSKIGSLAIAKQSGFTVPPFVVASLKRDHGYRADSETVSHLLESLNQAEFQDTKYFAVRSGFAIEDGKTQSMAGQFVTVLNVERDDIANALTRVGESANKIAESLDQADVFVMPMIPAHLAGVAFTESEHEDDLVNYVTGLAEDLVSGRTKGENFALPKLRSFEKPVTEAAGGIELCKNRLQELLRDIRIRFGEKDWDIEWAFDGDTLWFLQIRPITSPTNRNELFTIANHKEILPELPSRFMSSMIESCSLSLFDYYHQFDPTLPKKRVFCESFQGRVYLNLSLFRDMMRIFGLPTTLVTNSIGGGDEGTVPINWSRLVRKWKTLMKLGIAQFLAGFSARKKSAQLLLQTSVKPKTFSEAADTARIAYIGLVQEMFSLTSAMSGPVATLRLFGVLNEHLSRPTSVTAQMWLQLSAISKYVKSQSFKDEEEALSDPQFKRMFESFLSSYGHRGLYESDLSRPRFREKPELLLEIIQNGVPENRSGRKRSLLGFFTYPFWLYARSRINAREKFRHECMRSFENVRTSLLELSKEKLDGLLTEEEFFLLSIDEVKSLDEGFRPTREYICELKRDRSELLKISTPNLLRRFDDLSNPGPDTSGPRNNLKGIGLTSGSITGTALYLDEPVTRLPEGFSKESTILVCKAIDPGWLATFALVSGVCVEIGGDLSHGSILLREIGIPSITNVDHLVGSVNTGDTLTIDAKKGTLKVVVRG